MQKHDYYFLYPKKILKGFLILFKKMLSEVGDIFQNDIEIIIFGDSKGAKEISDEVKGIYYPDVKCSKTECLFLFRFIFKSQCCRLIQYITFY